MSEKNILPKIIIAIILVNAAGILLRYFALDSYIIFVGFRFHLSFILPFFLILWNLNSEKLKQAFLHPDYNKAFQPLGWIFLPLIILLAALFLLKKAEIGDPDYFYEFGMSSIVDYPIYLIWNFPQLLMFAAFLILVQPSIKFRIIYTSLITFLLFAFEFIPLGKAKFDLLDLTSLLLTSIFVALLIKYFQNIYWLAITIFTIFWVNLLAFGSNSPALIHILFASQYETWDGFFDVAKNLHSYLLPFQLIVTVIIIYFSSLRKSSSL